MSNLREISKGHYSSEGNSFDALQTGCLQRIADATEAMSKSYVTLQNDVAWYRKRNVEQNETITALHRQISSLKGVITKLKKKQAK